MRYSHAFQIGQRTIAIEEPTYFVADAASNHDGSLERAKNLIWLAAEAGADAIKFQHFLAKDIVSDVGFRGLGSQIGHQSSWKKSVYEVYEECEFDRSWNHVLAEEAKAANIDFMTTPYDVAAIIECAPLVAAFKIGSGDVTWTQSIGMIGQQGKPVLLATGAADQADVTRAVQAVLRHNPDLCLMQCNTNYTGSLENFRFVNLNVLKSFAIQYPGMILGLSDHTPGHAAVLGAVTLGARVIEKHFTDDNDRTGPDHGFSMNPASWREMVDRTREVELALGDGIKRIEENELAGIVVQRRSLRLSRDLPAGAIIGTSDLVALRPAPPGSLPPYELDAILGRTLVRAKSQGEHLSMDDFGKANA
ncbi:MAG: N-acetylneuraminate synthase family protein [Sphingomonadales bacterium]